MDPKNKFDEQLKERLNQHSEQVPGHIWERIVEEREQRKGGFWRWSTLGLLLLILGAGVYVINENRKEQVAQSVNAGVVEKRNISPPNSDASGSGRKIVEAESHPMPHSKSQNKNTLLSGVLKNSTPSQLHEMSRQKESLNSRVKAADARLRQRNRNNRTASTKNNNTETNTANAATVRNNDNETTGGSNTDGTPPEVNKNGPELNDEGLMKTTLDGGSEIQNNNERAETNKEVVPQAPEAAAAGVLPLADTTPGAFKIEDSLQQEAKNDSAAEAQKINEAIKTMPYFEKHLVSFEIYMLPEHATKDLKEKPSEHDPDYLNLRKESETIDNAFSTGINLRYEINNHYFIRAGIRYSVINETFYSNQAKQEGIPYRDSTITGYIIDPFLQAVPIYKYDTAHTYKSVYSEQAIHNRYTFIDIPVSAGVQFNLKQFDFYFSAGVELNLLIGSSGKIAGQDTPDLIDLSSSQEPFKKAALGFQSGFGCAYHFSPTFEFILEPNFRKQLTSMTNDEYPLDQAYTRIGIMAGIKYNIR